MSGQGSRLGKRPQNGQIGFMCIMLLVRWLTQDLKDPTQLPYPLPCLSLSWRAPHGVLYWFGGRTLAIGAAPYADTAVDHTGKFTTYTTCGIITCSGDAWGVVGIANWMAYWVTMLHSEFTLL